MMMTGAIAISGTERSSIAIGMSACSAPLLSWNSAAAEDRGDETRDEPDEQRGRA